MDDVLGCAPFPLSQILGKVKGGNSTVYKCLGEDEKLYAVKVLEGDDARRRAAFARQISAATVLKESLISLNAPQQNMDWQIKQFLMMFLSLMKIFNTTYSKKTRAIQTSLPF